MDVNCTASSLEVLHVLLQTILFVLQTRYTNLNLARKLRPDVMERLYKKSDSTASVLSTSVLQGTEGKSTSAEVASSKQVKQQEGKKNVLELPARQKVSLV